MAPLLYKGFFSLTPAISTITLQHCSIPPAGDQPNKFTVPIVIEPELTREEMIEQLESKSKALADLAEKLRRQK